MKLDLTKRGTGSRLNLLVCNQLFSHVWKSVWVKMCDDITLKLCDQTKGSERRKIRWAIWDNVNDQVVSRVLDQVKNQVEEKADLMRNEQNMDPNRD